MGGPDGAVFIKVRKGLKENKDPKKTEDGDIWISGGGGGSIQRQTAGVKALREGQRSRKR